MVEYRRPTQVLRRCDQLRNQLKEAGIRLEDTPNGTTWKKISKEELKAEEEEKRKKEEENEGRGSTAYGEGERGKG